MKIRESGMSDAEMWNTFFTPEVILNLMCLTGDEGDVVDFGCGYGTFSIPAAKRIKGMLYGLDIDMQMIETSRQFANREKLHNARFELRDFMTEGTGLKSGSVNYVMLFNILHAEQPLCLLRESMRILAPGGNLGVVHWNYDPKTPRGPPLAIRPHPEDCRRWIQEAGFFIEKEHIDLPPYHYGILAVKKEGWPLVQV